MPDPVAADDEQQEVVEHELDEFESEEARRAFMRARRRRLAGAVLLCAVSVGIFCVTAYRTWRKAHPVLDKRQGTVKPLNIDPVGNPDAKIKVECILPPETDCHAGIIRLLQDVAKKYPDAFHVTFRSMAMMGDDAVRDKVGEVCSGVVINGNVHFEMDDGKGGVRQVNLVGTAPTHFSLHDVVAALTMEYTKVYGHPPEKSLKPDWPLGPKTVSPDSAPQKREEAGPSVPPPPAPDALPLKIKE